MHTLNHLHQEGKVTRRDTSVNDSNERNQADVFDFGTTCMDHRLAL